ncbi:hypothetical protein CAEBREN_17281, partial [Caenorhabditis brenneri]
KNHKVGRLEPKKKVIFSIACCSLTWGSYSNLSNSPISSLFQGSRCYV